MFRQAARSCLRTHPARLPCCSSHPACSLSILGVPRVPPPPPRFYPAGSPSVRLWRLAGVGAFLCRESAAQRNSRGAAGTRRLSLHFEFQAVSVQHEGKAALGVKKGFSFTLACMTCLCTLLAVFMKVVKIPTDLVGSAAPPEDQELLSFINIHSYYLKHTLWCLLGSPVPYIMRKVT